MNLMIKTAPAAVVLSASTAAPAFAQGYQSYSSGPYRDAPRFYRSHDVPPGSYAPRNNREFWNQENFEIRHGRAVKVQI